MLRDGGCLVRLSDLLSLPKLYPRRTNFTVEADANGLRIAKVPVRCWDYTDEVQPPGDFSVGRVVDLHVAGVIPVSGRHDPNRA